jgi:adenosylcobinamide kinase/adenosylcobinamide-phosphate guanylyltransferase
MAEVILVLGGCRSGKSSWARAYAEAHFRSGIFVATAQALDDEMAERIRRHQQERGPFWRTVEVPFDLARYLKAPDPMDVVLVDCLTLWLSNMLLRDGVPLAEQASAALVEAIAACPLPLICIANEVGLGIVPDNALARQFRDLAGFLNQKIAGQAHRVVFMAAGIPIADRTLR